MLNCIFLQLYNSWYNKNTAKAESIHSLINIFKEQGNGNINAACDDKLIKFSAADWNSFSAKQQQEILMEYRLAFQKESYVNWCPALGTVLANDEIVNGVSERGGHPVIRKKMTQWSMRISAYAERLLQGLESIDWTESLKESQRNWIGKSVGASVSFNVIPSAVEGSCPSPRRAGPPTRPARRRRRRDRGGRALEHPVLAAGHAVHRRREPHDDGVERVGGHPDHGGLRQVHRGTVGSGADVIEAQPHPRRVRHLGSDRIGPACRPSVLHRPVQIRGDRQERLDVEPRIARRDVREGVRRRRRRRRWVLHGRETYPPDRARTRVVGQIGATAMGG